MSGSRRVVLAIGGVVVLVAVTLASWWAFGGSGDDDALADCLRIDPTTFPTYHPDNAQRVSLDEARELVDWIRLPAALPEPAFVLAGSTACPEAWRDVQVNYEGPDYRLTLFVNRGRLGNYEPRETPVSIGDWPGRMGYRGANDEFLLVTWETDEQYFQAVTERAGGLTQEEFLAILESIPD
jgi:hypothetical protein